MFILNYLKAVTHYLSCVLLQLQDPGVQLGDRPGDLAADLRDARLPLPRGVLGHPLGRRQAETGLAEAARGGAHAD